jgi:predicted nucleic acid-binding protein
VEGSGEMACLDTTFLIDLVGGGGKARCARAAAKLRELARRGETLFTTRLNVAELYVGVYRADDPEREEGAVRALLTGVQVLDFGDREARLFGQLTASLQMRGRPAGDMDVMIAATALTGRQLLVTDNPTHFTNIPDLNVESY